MRIEQEYSNQIPLNLNTLVKDLRDIDILFISHIKREIKHKKQIKIKFTLYACIEHTIGITSGIWALANTQTPIIIIAGTTSMLISATFGFKFSELSNSFKQDLQTLRTVLSETMTFVETATKEEINEIANVIRQQYTQKQK